MSEFAWMWGDLNPVARANPLRRNAGTAEQLAAELQKLSDDNVGCRRPVLVAKVDNRWWLDPRLEWVECATIGEAIQNLEILAAGRARSGCSNSGDFLSFFECGDSSQGLQDVRLITTLLHEAILHEVAEKLKTALSVGSSSEKIKIILEQSGWTGSQFACQPDLPCLFALLQEQAVVVPEDSAAPTMVLFTDDAELARCAEVVDLSEDGYQELASFRSNYAMGIFAHRIVAARGWQVNDSSKFTHLMWQYSGVGGTRTYAELVQALADADWTQDSITMCAADETQKQGGQAAQDDAQGSCSKMGEGGPKGKGKGKTASAPPPKGKGKGDGRVKIQPSREECAAWQKKHKNSLYWKRSVRGEQLCDQSWFAHDEIDFDDERLAELFEKTASKQPRVSLVANDNKPSIFGSNSRRLHLEIQMRGLRDILEVFLERLCKLQMREIVDDADSSRLMPIFTMVDEMNSNGKEWSLLASADDSTLKSKYMWTDYVEGFLYQLQAIPYFQERLRGLKDAIEVEVDLQHLLTECETLSEGMHAIQSSQSILQPLFLKLLCIGNRLNAGSSLGRSDAFDVIELLYTTNYLRDYKGKNGITLLQYFVEECITDENRRAFKGLSKTLFSIMETHGASVNGGDSTDVAATRTRMGQVTRKLGSIEQTMVKGQQRREAEGGEKNMAELKLMATFLKPLNEQKEKCFMVEAKIDGLQEQLNALKLCLSYAPRQKEELVIGKILLVIEQFAKRLAEPPKPVQLSSALTARRRFISRQSASRKSV